MSSSSSCNVWWLSMIFLYFWTFYKLCGIDACKRKLVPLKPFVSSPCFWPFSPLCSVTATVLLRWALASKQLAREPRPPHWKPSLTPLGLDRLRGGVSVCVCVYVCWVSVPGFLTDGWRRVQRDAAPVVDSPVSSVHPPSGRRHEEGRVALIIGSRW